MTLPLSGCSFGWLHLAPLPDALRALASRGFSSLELTTAPPHLSAPGAGPYERQELARLLDDLGLRVTSVNPSFADINLISTNPEFRELSERQLIANIERERVVLRELDSPAGFLRNVGDGPTHIEDPAAVATRLKQRRESKQSHKGSLHIHAITPQE